MKTIPHDLFDNDNRQKITDVKNEVESIVLDKDLRLKLTKYISTFSTKKELIEVKGKLIDFIRSM